MGSKFYHRLHIDFFILGARQHIVQVQQENREPPIKKVRHERPMESRGTGMEKFCRKLQYFCKIVWFQTLVKIYFLVIKTVQSSQSNSDNGSKSSAVFMEMAKYSADDFKMACTTTVVIAHACVTAIFKL